MSCICPKCAYHRSRAARFTRQHCWRGGIDLTSYKSNVRERAGRQVQALHPIPIVSSHATWGQREGFYLADHAEVPAIE